LEERPALPSRPMQEWLTATQEIRALFTPSSGSMWSFFIVRQLPANFHYS